ncbi:MAG: hypothetical protein AAFW87_02050 [Pseudomonadota bacterium]
MPIIRNAAFTALAGVMALATAPAYANNLAASLNVTTGTVSVQNTGGFAPATLTTIHCAGVCPDPVGPLVAPYLNAALPNRIVVPTPALGPNQTYNHPLPFWPTLDFSGGGALLVTCADGAKQVFETNEADNCTKQAHGKRSGKPKKLRIGKERLKLGN